MGSGRVLIAVLLALAVLLPGVPVILGQVTGPLHVSSISTGWEHRPFISSDWLFCVTVVDEAGARAPGVAVTGTVNGAPVGPELTDGDGVAEFVGTVTAFAAFTFQLGNLSLAGAEYDPSANVVDSALVVLTGTQPRESPCEVDRPPQWSRFSMDLQITDRQTRDSQRGPESDVLAWNGSLTHSLDAVSYDGLVFELDDVGFQSMYESLGVQAAQLTGNPGLPEGWLRGGLLAANADEPQQSASVRIESQSLLVERDPDGGQDIRTTEACTGAPVDAPVAIQALWYEREVGGLREVVVAELRAGSALDSDVAVECSPSSEGVPQFAFNPFSSWGGRTEYVFPIVYANEAELRCPCTAVDTKTEIPGGSAGNVPASAISQPPSPRGATLSTIAVDTVDFSFTLRMETDPTLFVTERFTYPEAFDQGSTLFRYFSVRDITGAPAPNVSVRLLTDDQGLATTCFTEAAGELQCEVPTDRFAPAREISFSFDPGSVTQGPPISLTQGAAPPPVLRSGNQKGLPRFSVSLKDRSTTTRVAGTLTENAEVSGLGLLGAVTGVFGNALVFEIKDGRVDLQPVTVESSESGAIEGGTGGKVGAKLGIGEASLGATATARATRGLKGFRSVEIRLDDLGLDDQGSPKPSAQISEAQEKQRTALSLFLLDDVVERAASLVPLGPLGVLVLDEYLKEFLGAGPGDASYRPFVVHTEIGAGITAAASATVSVGVRGGKGRNEIAGVPIGVQLGVEGSGEVLVSLRQPIGSGPQHVFLRANIGVGGNVTKLWEIGKLDELLPSWLGATIGLEGDITVGLEVDLEFPTGPISLDSLTGVTLTVSAETTDRLNATLGPVPSSFLSPKAIQGDALSLSFTGEAVREVTGSAADALRRAIEDLLLGQGDGYSLAAAEDLIGKILAAVDGAEIRKTHSEGWQFGLTANVTVGVGAASVALSVGGTWGLTHTQDVEVWRVHNGRIVKVSGLAYAPPLEDDAPILLAVGQLVTLAAQHVYELSPIDEAVARAWTELEALIDENKEGLKLIIKEGTEAFERTGQSAKELLIEIRSLAKTIFRFLGVTQEAPRAAQGIPSFAQSDVYDIAPDDVTFDPAVDVTLDYAEDFEGDPADLRVFRYDAAARIWRPVTSTFDPDGRTVTGAVTEFGTFIVGHDLTPPTVDVGELNGGLLATIGDTGSGVDPGSIELLVDGRSSEFEFDADSGTFGAFDLPAGARIALTVADGAGNESVFEGRILGDSRTVDLGAGFNLVGWTGVTAIEEALSTVDGTVGGVFTWNPGTERFLSFTPGAPAFINDLEELVLGDGLWINIAGTGATWTQPAFAGARSVALVAGLQLAIWTGPDGTSIAAATAGIAGSLVQILVWDAATQSFRSFNASLPAALNSLSALNYGDAFWIEVDAAVTWEQPSC